LLREFTAADFMRSPAMCSHVSKSLMEHLLCMTDLCGAC